MQSKVNRCHQGRESAALAKLNQRWRRAGRMFACLAVAVVLMGAAQAGQQTPGQDSVKSQPLPQVNGQQDAGQPEQKDAQPQGQPSAEPAGADHKRQIDEDSATLLKLASDLKTEVDKTNQDTLSLAVIRKASEIERLARELRKNRM